MALYSMRKREQSPKGLYCCPCCGYATLGEPEAYEICAVCGWEDDGQDDPEHKANWGGPNHVSLEQGRINFIVTGQSEVTRRMPPRDPSECYEQLRKFSVKVVESKI